MRSARPAQARADAAARVGRPAVDAPADAAAPVEVLVRRDFDFRGAVGGKWVQDAAGVLHRLKWNHIVVSHVFKRVGLKGVR